MREGLVDGAGDGDAPVKALGEEGAGFWFGEGAGKIMGSYFTMIRCGFRNEFSYWLHNHWNREATWFASVKLAALQSVPSSN